MNSSNPNSFVAKYHNTVMTQKKIKISIRPNKNGCLITFFIFIFGDEARFRGIMYVPMNLTPLAAVGHLSDALCLDRISTHPSPTPTQSEVIPFLCATSSIAG
jgi:hypothetical protein